MVDVRPFSVTIISESTAANRVNNGEKNEDTKAYERGMPGIFLDVIKDRFLARIAVVAHPILFVAPSLAVDVSLYWSCFWHDPSRCILELKVAVCRRFATTRLTKNIN